VFEEAGYSLFGALVINGAAPDEGNQHLLSHIADAEQHSRYLWPLARGDIRSAFAMTEPSPGAGSDPRAVVSSAQALPLLRQSATTAPGGRSHVVAITSIEGVFPEYGLSAYGASKASLISLVRSINAEENDRGVLATAISPAFVATELSAWVTGTIPSESMISVEDVVSVVNLLLTLSPNACIPHVVINRIAAGPYRA
jgi:NAD(P)-dependent dehydrogenase (short-subunit alcohol dehydrogenase family)